MESTHIVIMSSDDRPFRRLSDKEQTLLKCLLSEDFPGRDAIVKQISKCEARGDLSGILELRTQERERAEVTCSIPVQGVVKDEDGMMIRIDLYVRDGFVDALEVYRDDHEPLRAAIRTENVVVSRTD